MNGNTSPEPQPAPDADDLGLTSEEWLDLGFAYNYGLIDPAPETVEAEAFRRLDEYARWETEHNATQREREEQTVLRHNEHEAGQ